MYSKNTGVAAAKASTPAGAFRMLTISSKHGRSMRWWILHKRAKGQSQMCC